MLAHPSARRIGNGNPKPQQPCVRFEATETGYLMVAYGIVDGKAVAETPQAGDVQGIGGWKDVDAYKSVWVFERVVPDP